MPKLALQSFTVYATELFAGHALSVAHAISESGEAMSLTMSTPLVEQLAAELAAGRKPKLGLSSQPEPARRAADKGRL